MEDFKSIILFIVSLLKIEFNVWGFNLSLWAIFVYGILASIVLWAIFKIFKGGD